MPIFKYHARNNTGVDKNGEIESNDAHEAAGVIRRQGLVVISISPKSPETITFFQKFFNRVSSDEVVNFTRQIATMIEAGLVLSEAVDILSEQQSKKRFKEVLEEISADLKGGLSFAASLSRYPDIFHALYVNLVKAGEASGKLDEVLNRMADTLEKEREFRARIKGAMIYPAVVITMMFLVIVLMMVFVIPKLTGFYTQSSLELPLPTKILIAISDLFVNFWWAMIIVNFSVIFGFKRFLATPHGRLSWDKFLLNIPKLGTLISNVILTNFNRTFALLTSAGIPMLDAINIVKDVTDNSVYKEGLKTAYNGVESGLTFSQQLISLPYFPRLMGQMVRVGEETGKIDEIFKRLADFYETESDHAIKNLTVAIEPIILVVLGIGVAFLVIAIILPIYTLTTNF
jgi:type IV pilus assembly protein PilC